MKEEALELALNHPDHRPFVRKIQLEGPDRERFVRGLQRLFAYEVLKEDPESPLKKVLEEHARDAMEEVYKLLKEPPTPENVEKYVELLKKIGDVPSTDAINEFLKSMEKMEDPVNLAIYGALLRLVHSETREIFRPRMAFDYLLLLEGARSLLKGEILPYKHVEKFRKLMNRLYVAFPKNIESVAAVLAILEGAGILKTLPEVEKRLDERNKELASAIIYHLKELEDFSRGFEQVKDKYTVYKGLRRLLAHAIDPTKDVQTILQSRLPYGDYITLADLAREIAQMDHSTLFEELKQVVNEKKLRKIVEAAESMEVDPWLVLKGIQRIAQRKVDVFTTEVEGTRKRARPLKLHELLRLDPTTLVKILETAAFKDTIVNVPPPPERPWRNKEEFFEELGLTPEDGVPMSYYKDANRVSLDRLEGKLKKLAELLGVNFDELVEEIPRWPVKLRALLAYLLRRAIDPSRKTLQRLLKKWKIYKGIIPSREQKTKEFLEKLGLSPEYGLYPSRYKALMQLNAETLERKLRRIAELVGEDYEEFVKEIPNMPPVLKNALARALQLSESNPKRNSFLEYWKTYRQTGTVISTKKERRRKERKSTEKGRLLEQLGFTPDAGLKGYLYDTLLWCNKEEFLNLLKTVAKAIGEDYDTFIEELPKVPAEFRNLIGIMMHRPADRNILLRRFKRLWRAYKEKGRFVSEKELLEERLKELGLTPEYGVTRSNYHTTVRGFTLNTFESKLKKLVTALGMDFNEFVKVAPTLPAKVKNRILYILHVLGPDDITINHPHVMKLAKRLRELGVLPPEEQVTFKALKKLHHIGRIAEKLLQEPLLVTKASNVHALLMRLMEEEDSKVNEIIKAFEEDPEKGLKLLLKLQEEEER